MERTETAVGSMSPPASCDSGGAQQEPASFQSTRAWLWFSQSSTILSYSKNRSKVRASPAPAEAAGLLSVLEI